MAQLDCGLAIDNVRDANDQLGLVRNSQLNGNAEARAIEIPSFQLNRFESTGLCIARWQNWFCSATWGQFLDALVKEANALPRALIEFEIQ
jgi:hypothetical protein